MVSNSPEGYRVKCDLCGAQYFYSVDKLDEYGSVECQNCTARIFVDSFQGTIGTSILDNDTIIPSKETDRVVEEGIKIKCPHCLARYIYKEHQIIENNQVKCQNCGRTIDAIGEDVLIYDEHPESGGSENIAIICLLVIIFLFLPPIIAIPTIACLLLMRAASENKRDDGERKIIRQDGQGPSVR
jgi:predicted Zn finger-like uncharacterized protein